MSAAATLPRWRRHRLVVVLVLATTLAVALAVLAGGGARSQTPLDPRNAGPDGTRALVSVLADRGVEVVVVRDAAALEATRVDSATTVVVSSSDDLGASSLDRLRTHVGGARTVLLEPGGAVWSLLVGDDRASEVGSLDAADGVRADCDVAVPGAVADEVADLVLSVDRAATYAAPGCFADGTGRAALVLADDVVVLGAADALTNDTVLRGDDAALGLRLLGGGERLVWYVPDLRDLGGSDAVTLRSLLPPWVLPGLVLAGLALALVVPWRGRRLGALVVEPLPVVVRATETVLSRGRLYRHAGDRAHAAEVLRGAARGRLRDRLGTAGPPAVAARTGRDPAEVARLLEPGGPPPGSDHDLIMLAQDLDRLDREAQHP